jgi:hypothetical protein
MMDSFKQSDGTIGFRNVHITDIEDAVVLPPDSQGLGKRLSGNQFWRSPKRGQEQRSIPQPTSSLSAS